MWHGLFMLVSLVGGSLLTGCLTVKNSYEQDALIYKRGSGDDDGGSPKAERLAAVRAVWNRYHCGSCHAAGGSPPLVMALDDAGWLAGDYVVPGDPGNSYLHQKLNHSGCAPGGGLCNMPSASTKIADADMSIIEDWINRLNEP